MIPVSLKLSNFTSYGENVPELNFSKFHLAAISGQNGTGKSSILDAITWCVWGWSRAGDNADQLVRLGATDMQVEFSFDLDGNEFTVKRRRSTKSGGNSALEFWSTSHNLTEGTIKTTQQKIIDTLHLSFETFTNSSFLRQGHADEFTTKGPTDRKRILADILGLSHYDSLEEKAKEKIKEAENKLKLLEYQLLEIDAELSQKEQSREKKILAEKKITEVEKNISVLEKDLKDLGAQRASLVATSDQQSKLKQTLYELQTELNDILTQGKARAEKIKSLEKDLKELPTFDEKLKELKSLEKQKEDYSILSQKKMGLENQLTQIKSALALKNQERETLDKKLLEIKSHIEVLEKDSAKCPTCGQEINTIQKQSVTADFRSKIKELEIESGKIKTATEEADINKLQSEVDSIQLNDHNYQETIRKINELSTLQETREILIAAQATLESEKKVVIELRGLFTNKKSQIEKLEEEIKKLPGLGDDLLKLGIQVNQKELELTNLRTEEKEARNLLGQATELISRAEQIEKLSKQKLEEKSTLQKEKDAFEELSLAFGKKGIQAMIIETAIPEIEDEANFLLEKLTEGRMKVTFETQRETKTKVETSEGKVHALVETLDIIISDEMGERPYEMYSLDGNELVYIRQNGQIRSVPIRELWQEDQTTYRQGEYQLQNSDIEALCYINGKALWQKINKILRHKSPPKILEVKCGPGNYTVRLTKNHSIYVLTPNGIKVKRTDQLKPGDYLLSPRLIPEEKSINQLDLNDFISMEFKEKRSVNHKAIRTDDESIWSRSDQKINRYITVNPDWGKLIGIAVAEGSGQTGYSIAAGSSVELASEVVQIASKYFGTPERSLIFVSAESMKLYMQKASGISSNNPQAQYRPYIGGRLVAHIIKNMIGNKASMKRVPDFIFNASKEVKLAFIRGLIMGDGYTYIDSKHSKSQVALTTTSPRLVGELIFLCRQLGIWARVENHGEAGFRRGMNHQKSYRVVISGKKNLELLEFGKVVSRYDATTKYEGIPYNLVGVSRINSERFPRGVENQTFECGLRRIPKVALENYIKIQKLVEDWNILEVKEITKINPTSEYVYDLMVPGNNSFVAGNGAILIHNSGGEAFRVNFAIRIALSKLLTRRAGAKLQFLIIDEGFGTQDAEGRSRVVEVLDTIKNDFEKILIITHLEELKEEFPVRIEVSKNSGGSTFQVIGD